MLARAQIVIFVYFYYFLFHLLLFTSFQGGHGPAAADEGGEPVGEEAISDFIYFYYFLFHLLLFTSFQGGHGPAAADEGGEPVGEEVDAQLRREDGREQHVHLRARRKMRNPEFPMKDAES